MHDAAERPAVQTQKDAPARPYVVFEDGRDGGRALLFSEPEEIIVAREPGDVAQAFARMEAATKRGLHLAGYASYELGYALEPKFSTQTTPHSRTPLLLFGAFRAPRSWSLAPGEAEAPRVALTPAWTQAEYAERFQKCRDYIFAGDVYQINLTFPLYGALGEAIRSRSIADCASASPSPMAGSWRWAKRPSSRCRRKFSSRRMATPSALGR